EVEAVARDRAYVFVQQTGPQQGAYEEPDPSRRVEVIDVSRTVRIDAGQRRYARGEVGQVAPREVDAGGPGYRDEVQRVVVRPTAREQCDACVDDRLLVDELADGR